VPSRAPLRSQTRGKGSSSTGTSLPPSFPPTTSFRPRNSSTTVNFLSHSLSFSFAWISSAKELIVQEFPSRIAVLSDDVPLVVSRQLLQSFAQELGKLEPEAQKDIAHYALAQIQPRVVSFEEQVRFAQAIGSRLFSYKLY
jgi:hypothetical protein